MARLVTVEQAARMAGIDADELVSRLNGQDAAADAAAQTTEAGNVMATETGARPAALAAIDEERIVVLDVRDELRAGREPFSLIMGALRSVPEGGALVIRAIFEPVPLYAVMKRQGLEHWTEELAADDWRVSFYPPAAAADATAASPGASTAPAPTTRASAPS